jgi:SAM-dependent methyltransferase
MEYYSYKGFNIPIDLMLKTGGGPDTFAALAEQHVSNVAKYVGVAPDSAFLEVGCGIGRDAIPLTEHIRSGSYCGIDIIRESIDWCSANITPRFPQFHFVHLNVNDQLHNPHGTISPETVRLPVLDESVDRIILQSVFTHMLPGTVVHYLCEFQRLLKPAGLVYATCFLVTPAILTCARRTNLTPYDLRFEHKYADGCYVNEPAIPTGAVAYEIEALEAMLKIANLKLERPPLPGAWSGYHSAPVDGQDILILHKAL